MPTFFLSYFFFVNRDDVYADVSEPDGLQWVQLGVISSVWFSSQSSFP